MILLKISGLAKSVYYYTLSKKNKDDKNKEIIDKIKEIFNNNKERYGYRRITLELKNQGYNVNHKKVYRIMVKLGLKPLKRNKRKKKVITEKQEDLRKKQSELASQKIK